MVLRRLLVAGIVLVGLVATAGASAQTRPGTVALKVRVTGLGTVSVTGGASFRCREYPCVHTFHVRPGHRVVVTATAKKGWKLTKWAGACKGSPSRCSYRATGWRTVLVTFVPPGNWLNPYPLGTPVTLEGGWRVKVNAAKLDATAEVEAVVDPYSGDHPNPAPRAGYQYALVNLSMKSVEPMSLDVPDFLSRLSQLGAAGKVGGLYPADTCQPPEPDLGWAGQVTEGQTLRGNLCYLIPSADASTLRLDGVLTSQRYGEPFVWFALR